MTALRLSHVGDKMASHSGLRSIMEDISTSIAANGRTWFNLGIGNPAAIPQVTETWQRLTSQAVAETFGTVSCSYGGSRGLPRLIEAIVGYFRLRYGWDIGPEHVVVGPGSQMLCFGAAALFTGAGSHRGDRLLLPLTPDYTGYQAMSLTQDSTVGVDPVIVPAGPRSFRYDIDLPSVRRQTDVGLMLLSNPSNPAGRSYPTGELEQLVDIAGAHGAPMLVDNAYGAPFPAITERDVAPVQHPLLINSFSVSKAGLPGERLGFAIGDPRYMTPMVSFLTNSVLHASQLVQATLARALESDALDALVATAIRPFYADRRKLVAALLDEYLPEDVAWRVHESDGGMFFWIWVDEEWFDDLRFYRLLRDRGVFVAPGRHFFTDEHGSGGHATRCFRVSITPDPETLEVGVVRIGRTLREMRTTAP